MRPLPPLLALVLLSACNSGGASPTAGGVTAEEARALDDAAAMVEARRMPDDLAPSPASQPGADAPAGGGK